MSGDEFEASMAKFHEYVKHTPLITEAHARVAKYTVELSKRDSEVQSLKAKIQRMKEDTDEKAIVIAKLTSLCKEHGINVPVLAIKSASARPSSPPIFVPSTRSGRSSADRVSLDDENFPALSLETASAPAAMETPPGLNVDDPYPPGIYEEIPCRGTRGGPSCACKCRQFARWLCRAETQPEPFVSPLFDSGSPMIDVESRYCASPDLYASMSQCITMNMTRERAIYSFNVCKACNCCERHKIDFPSSFGVIEPELAADALVDAAAATAEAAADEPEIIRDNTPVVNPIDRGHERAITNVFNQISNETDDATNDDSEGPWIPVRRDRNHDRNRDRYLNRNRYQGSYRDFTQREGEFYDTFYGD